MRVKVTRNYQVTIPAGVRKALGIKQGDVLEVVCDKKRGVIVMRKVTGKRRVLRCGRRLTPEEIEELIVAGLSSCLK
ncbi:AbrB/MazE/SpoVT family DNA-binding domain-containing protein [archaeon]|nr:AbrB/MazE/SpoVT family DNA-binding domain-containing protein [archaeon]